MNDEFKRSNSWHEAPELPAPRVVHPTRARKGLQTSAKTTSAGTDTNAPATTSTPRAPGAAGGRVSEG
jgi:hypothetical protein